MIPTGDNDEALGAALPPRLHIDPPLFNSANPWATTLEDLRALHACASTGAVTTRTALLGDGFAHDESIHRFAFFEAGTHRAGSSSDASLNTLGYSPIPLAGYLGFIKTIDGEVKRGEGVEMERRRNKPFIVSVTGSPDEVAECYRCVAALAHEVAVPLAMEVNLSCPNIPGKPPPAYDGAALRAYVGRIAEAVTEGEGKGRGKIPWGVKTPPYTHAGQFEMFAAALREGALAPPGKDTVSGSESRSTETCPLSFVTATNTLGSCLLLTEGEGESESGEVPLGIGGVAGAPLHPLALGNVATLRRLLDAAPETAHVAVLGIGGVADAAGYRRMRRVGAAAVGVGTALGIKGLGFFGEIEGGLGGVWEV
ncbi:hypothetical protein F4825DRAFT_161686 [Nemania diffusa]|nr:hypothetical protein F4825DRAFT_161686 [Nemania diffusa]